MVLLSIKIERKGSIQGNDIKMNSSQAKECESSVEEKPQRSEISPTGNPQVIVVKGLCFDLYNVQ